MSRNTELWLKWLLIATALYLTSLLIVTTWPSLMPSVLGFFVGGMAMVWAHTTTEEENK